ncbi:helix-hairpin-helix domain-containing protein [Halosquirtibacter xylanolyticus]|uniref:hypothetical protein n=1 Tax=Halosquirtibacter xylanolyticus TaxID=3374599 RepID=UPI003748D533|nr:helix-hairpin-helix domain-containing protein [Prolixibacteraceae bacterium]
MKVYYFYILQFTLLLHTATLSSQPSINESSFQDTYNLYASFHLEEPFNSETNPLSLTSLQKWYFNPISINQANRETLLQIPLFNAMDIQTLLDYRQKHGYIYTINELEVLLHLDPLTSDLLSFLISFHLPNAKKSPRKLKGYSAVTLSNKKRSNKVSFEGFDKYKKQERLYIEKGKWSLKAIGESDYGETKIFHDHLSATLQYKGQKTQWIIGDFKPNYGQGVSFSTSSFFSSNTPDGIINNVNKIQSHALAEENNFFRGIAITQKVGAFKLIGYYSQKSRDAYIRDKDTEPFFSSTSSDGIHISQSQIAKHNALEEKAKGAALEYSNKNVKIIGYYHNGSYSVPLKKLNAITSEYLPSIDNFNIYGAAYHIYLKKFHLFGEVAWDPYQQIGQIHGIYGAILPHLHTTIGYRSYPITFYAPYGNAYAVHSSCKNEKGPFIINNFEMSRKFKIQNTLSYFNEIRPIDLQDQENKNSMKITTTINYLKSSSTSLQLKHQWKSYHRSYKRNHRAYPYSYTYQNIRIKGSKEISSKCTINTEFQWTTLQKDELSEQGLLGRIYAKILLFPKSTTYIQAALFDTDSFQSRLFTYEQDLRYNFSCPSYYGKGQHFFILERLELTPWCQISTKIAWTEFTKTKKLNQNKTIEEKEKINSYSLMLMLKL